MAAPQRLLRALQLIQKTPLDGFELTDASDVFNWYGVVVSPSDSPYRGKKIKVHIKFGTTYPFKAPTVQVLEILVPENPHILNEPKTGEHGNVCMKLLTEGWGPTAMIKHVIAELRSILSETK